MLHAARTIARPSNEFPYLDRSWWLNRPLCVTVSSNPTYGGGEAKEF